MGSCHESVIPHDRFGLNRKIKETTEANFSDEGGLIFRSSHDSLCTDLPPLRIFPEGRGVCTQDTPMIHAHFRHEYCFSFPCVICLIGRSIEGCFFEVFSWNT